MYIILLKMEYFVLTLAVKNYFLLAQLLWMHLIIHEIEMKLYYF